MPARPAISRDSCRLYLITPPVIEKPFEWVATLEAALDAGDVACLQIRLKGLEDDALARVVDVLRPPAQRRGVAVLLNDRPDLAFETGCDGVHVGQTDASYKEARQAVGAGGIVGVTCHDSRHLAMEAGEAGADYVAFGAFFPTETKDAPTRAGIEILEWWHGLFTVPSVAIGGITVENCRPLVTAGADFLAVSGGVWNHPEGPAAAVRAFSRIMAEGG
ncbi:thiamine-phosphate pyrophosphorylase [Paramagnetospirillum caucaseum]|uniref:Thiamine-phosphate synthase n=1 Tax=Paramagnetospirillum caucaseum TaxID=1244869 RepID=M2Z3I9_9PROT|nr:thiamine phosphate synthase [Paramagnetospirillum caucaseum]EME68935.1 thiamine-phosphate pyrophosphorylase [Paramagnetospirillum caucaseum]